MDAGSSWLKEDRGRPQFRFVPSYTHPGAALAQPAELRLAEHPSPTTRALQQMVASVCTDKQKALLAVLVGSPLTPTRAIRVVSRQLDCAESSVWSALAKLKEFGLVVPIGQALVLAPAAREAFR